MVKLIVNIFLVSIPFWVLGMTLLYTSNYSQENKHDISSKERIILVCSISVPAFLASLLVLWISNRYLSSDSTLIYAVASVLSFFVIFIIVASLASVIAKSLDKKQFSSKDDL